MGTNTSTAGETQAVLDAIRRIVQALRESSRRAERHSGLSGAQLFVLQTLAGAPASSVNELAARTHTHQSSVSMVVARLVDQRLVRREPSAVDGRTVGLALTARGRRAAEGAPDLAQQRLIQAIGRLTPARRRALAASLREVVDGLTVPEGAPAMFFEDSQRRRSPARA